MDLQILEVTKLEKETGGAYRASAARGNVREMIEMHPEDFWHVPSTIHGLFSAVSLGVLTETLGKHVMLELVWICSCAHTMKPLGVTCFPWWDIGARQGVPMGLHGGCCLSAPASFCTTTFLCCLRSWRAPRYILGMSEARHDRVRKKYHILVEGEGIPPPIKSFKEMKFPAGRPGEEPGRVGDSVLLGNARQRAKLSDLSCLVLVGLQLKFPTVAVSPSCWPKGCLSLVEELQLGRE